MVFKGDKIIIEKRISVLFNDALNTFSYGYMASVLKKGKKRDKTFQRNVKGLLK